MLQSTQRIINAHYNQRLFTLRDLATKYEANRVRHKSVHLTFNLYLGPEYFTIDKCVALKWAYYFEEGPLSTLSLMPHIPRR
jgi:hypothetical protein